MIYSSGIYPCAHAAASALFDHHWMAYDGDKVSLGHSAMRYTNQFQNSVWLYTVWRSDDHSDHILVAVVPGVGWQDIAIRLTADEVETLRRSEEEFTEYVKRFVSERETPPFRQRRMESTIRMQGSDVLFCGE